MIQYVIV